MTRRVALGRWANGVGSGFGLRTSLLGRDALSSDDRDLSFSSDWVMQTPILLRGVTSLSGSSAVSIGFPDQGYTPHAQFLVQAVGQPSGYTPVLSSQYATYQDSADNDTSSVLMQAFSDHLAIKYQLYKVGADTQGWPNGVNVAYVVYKIPAFF